MNLRQEPMFLHRQGNCPDLSHYQAFRIQYQNDAGALEAAIHDVISCHDGLIDRQRAEKIAELAAAAEMSIGEQGTRITLEVIRQVVRQMGSLPGQHALILILPGFIALTPEAMQAKAQIMDRAAQANVTVNALDARGLYTYMLDTSKSEESLAEERVRHDSLDASGDVMEELASGSGGTYFHNSNDLGGGLKSLTQALEYLYQKPVKAKKNTG